MHDIEALAKRIILIGKGKILYDGTFNKLIKDINTLWILGTIKELLYAFDKTNHTIIIKNIPNKFSSFFSFFLIVEFFIW